MKLLSPFLILLFLIGGCKQKKEVEKPEIEESKQETKILMSPIFKELVKFGEIKFEEESDISELLDAKKIDTSGVLTDIDIKSGIVLYKEVLNKKTPVAYPIFEISNSKKTILLVRGHGYTGAIWAKILVDKTNLEIQKVQFDHKAESEGYGADITLSSFENKFIGTKISFTSTPFGLIQSDKIIMKGDQKIDGISGATITSEATVKMINDGLLNYQNYLH